MKNFTCVITSTKPDMNNMVIAPEALQMFLGANKHIFTNFDFSKPPIGQIHHLEIKEGKLIGIGTIADSFLEECHYIAPSFRAIVEHLDDEKAQSIITSLIPQDYGLVCRHTDEDATPIKEV